GLAVNNAFLRSSNQRNQHPRNQPLHGYINLIDRLKNGLQAWVHIYLFPYIRLSGLNTICLVLINNPLQEFESISRLVFSSYPTLHLRNKPIHLRVSSYKNWD